MNIQELFAALEPALKPEAKAFFDNDLIPMIKASEDKIGNALVKELVEGLTVTLESVADGALA